MRHSSDFSSHKGLTMEDLHLLSAIHNIMVKIRGRIFSRKGEMMRIKAQRIRDTSFYNKYWEFNLNFGKFRFRRL